ncbi:MAG: hypothetical protein ACE5FL_07100 [Myxococcota bacterium]
MNEQDRKRRMTAARRSIALLAAGAIVVAAGASGAREPFAYADRPIHPGCIHALAMHQGDTVPVTTAVSLEGCTTSERSRSEVHHTGDLAVIADEALLGGGGSFGYRVINQLENGIFGLAIRRVLPGGEEQVSLAAVKLIARPMILHGATVRLMLIELLGEVWVPEIQLSSFESIGNKVHFVSGTGTERVERTVDFTRIGKQRK